MGDYSGLELADLDGDGDLDLIAANLTVTALCPNNPIIRGVQVWENDGKGRFLISTTFQVPQIDHCIGLAAGDLDGDGDIDIVAGRMSMTDVILLNDGRGRFTLSSALFRGTVKGSSNAIALGDFNRDGRLDIVIADAVTQGTLWLSTASGGYTESLLRVIKWPVAADLDGDGHVELIVEDYNDRMVHVYRASPSGSLTKVWSMPQFGSITAGDLDGDGDLDLVFWNAVYENLGGLKFANATTLLIEPSSPSPMTPSLFSQVLDIDNDGDNDIVGLGGDWNTTPSRRFETPVIIRNRRRHVEGPREVRIGNTLQVTTFADDRHVMFLGLSPREVHIPLPPLGTLRLDPAAMVLASMPSRNRAPQPWNLPVPNDTALAGLVAHLQGLDVDPGTRALFTRLLRVRVTR